MSALFLTRVDSHSFSLQALRARIVDCGCKVVITSDEGLRARKVIKLKAMVDAALDHPECAFVTTVLVHKRTGGEIGWKVGGVLVLVLVLVAVVISIEVVVASSSSAAIVEVVGSSSSS